MTEDESTGPARPIPVLVRVASIAAAVLVLIGIVALAVVGGEGSRPVVGPGAVTDTSRAPRPTTEPVTPSAVPDPTPALPQIAPTLCPAPLVHPLTALSFNIHGGTRGGVVRLERIAEEINRWDPDVVLLQEVDADRPRTGRRRQAEILGQLTGRSAVYGGNQPKPGGGTIGNAILSRHPVLGSTNIALPRSTGAENRGLLHAVLSVGGIEISVYSTHWDHRSAPARREQARATLATIRQDPRPALLGGDLNAGPGAPMVRLLLRGGLYDAWSAGAGPGFTVPANNPRARIDFLLHDARFSSTQAVTLHSAVSDHQAVWARFDLREELECLQVGDQPE